jgi:AraC-like DNA-binding protein
MKSTYTIELKDNTLNNKDKLVIKPYIHDDIAIHNHNFFELVYITGGTTIQTLNDVSYDLKKGDYFIVDYGSEHSYSHSKDLTLINCLFLPEIIDDTLQGCRSFETLLHVCLLRYYKLYLGNTSVNRIFHNTQERVLQLIIGILHEYEEKNVGYIEIFRCRLLEILILSIRNVISNTSLKTDNVTILEIIQYIKINYSQHNLLSKYCEQYHYSPQYISRKFKQETGFSLIVFLQKIRIEKSCELLAGSCLPVVDIAESVGYSDIKFYSNLFKKMIKMSPKEYRKMSTIS